ncbi:MAG: hypothetical protein PHW73_05950 [Atribacterota bacterium]|nr:hypothetical protein [Atribacterota bacterium]
MLKILNIFKREVRENRCCLCLLEIPKGEEYMEYNLLSPTLITSPNYFHQYCWEKYNDKIKWRQKTGTRKEAMELLRT